jgi:hypothetical protein
VLTITDGFARIGYSLSRPPDTGSCSRSKIMVPARPSAPAVALFGAIGSDHMAILARASTAEARQAALAQEATVRRVRARYGMVFSSSIN